MKTTRTLSVSLWTAIMLLTACAPSASVSMAESNVRRETQPPVLEGDVENLVAGNNAFAMDIYQSLRSESGNLILSPYSISLALAMTYAGARGETENQMAEVLHFTQGQGSTHYSFNALDLGLAQRGSGSDQDREPMQLNLANAVWAEQTFPFLQEFLDLLALNYGAGIHLADFINNFERERLTINDWVGDRTEDRIKDLIPKNVLNPNTRMVLVNAIYFKADWLGQFDADSTRDGSFNLLDGSQSTVDMMHNGMYIPYMQGNGYQAIELAYAGETAAMDVIVPDAGNFEAFEASFNQAIYDGIINGMQPVAVELGLPKFEFDRDFNLSDTLKDMGMPDAFDTDTADFSGMTGGRDLFIGDVVHKAFVAVDEEGTEAAAATAVIMETTSAPMYEISLEIDRPFIFIIRDKISGQILFIGRVLTPAK